MGSGIILHDIMDIIGGHQGNPRLFGHLQQGSVHLGLGADTMIL